MAQKRKIEDVVNTEEPQTKRSKHSVAELQNFSSNIQMQDLASPSVLTSSPFTVLPLEVISQHILKFFDFKDWLRLVIVCKQWQNAAVQSHLTKQLVYADDCTESATCSTIISKYGVNVLCIERRNFKFPALKTLLGSSTSITTLSLPDLVPKISEGALFAHIRTLAAKDLAYTRFFPNVVQLKLNDPAHTCWKHLTDEEQFPSVKELELNVSATEDFDFSLVTQQFPNVKRVFVNYLSRGQKEELEQDWNELEDIGKELGLEIICRNPHLSRRTDVFKLSSISYHEFFNGYTETPLQVFLGCDRAEICRELFLKHSSRQYEDDLFNREPQFNFPLRCPTFSPKVFKTKSSALSLETINSMVECGYIDCWKAIEFQSRTQSGETNQSAALLRAAKDQPLSKYAAKAIAAVVSDARLTVREVFDIVGDPIFKQIAQMKGNYGFTLLHWLAKKHGVTLKSKDYKLLAKYCDVNALDEEGHNAATIAFASYRQLWLKLVSSGAKIQSEYYTEYSSNQFLLELVFDVAGTTDVLELFDQQYLQRLMWLIMGKSLSWVRTRKVDVLEDLVRLGANPNDRVQSEPLISKIAATDQIVEFWPWIKKYKLDLNEINQKGYTPLMQSIHLGFERQAKFLLENGADPNVQSTAPSGAILRAVFLKKVLTNDYYFDLLRQHGADFTAEDEHGNTVLNYGVANYDCVHVWALSKLVPIDRPNHDNFTPLTVAITLNKVDLVAQLIEAGANVNAVSGPLLLPPLLTSIERGHSQSIVEQQESGHYN